MSFGVRGRAHRRAFAVLVAVFTVVLGARPAVAQHLVPGPTEEGFDAALEAKASRFDLQIHGFLTLSLGWGLEAFISNPDARADVEAFIASGGTDFESFSGRHPYEIIDFYEEFGDIGMFGGVQAAGDAFRYAVLRDEGADPPVVERARAAVIRALDGLHWYTQVTGQPGLVARGIRRSIPEDGDPPLPSTLPATTPLFDAEGNPLPVDKSAVWRDDASGELPFLIWLDDTSKDQLDGYVFALGVMYDVLSGDSTIPRELIDRLVADARAIGTRLMESVEVAPGRTADLVIQDADGRPTTFHDLSAEEIAPGVVFRDPTNGFNGWMALSIMRTLFHITGDETIGRFYYEDLLEARGYLQNVEDTIAVMYLGTMTNFSNVNMAFVAAYGLLRYESDQQLGIQVRAILETELYAPGVDRDADDLEQSFFDLMYVGFRTLGTNGPGADALEDGLRTLRDHPDAPYWNPEVTNCDDAEIASRDCVASDGTPIPLADGEGRGGGVVARDPLPMRLRPPSNFEWRSDPHSVNGGGLDRMNPGGDFHCAYWMGRYLRSGIDGFANVSPIARAAPPRAERPDAGVPPIDGGGEIDASVAPDARVGIDGDVVVGGGGSDSGCSCRAGTPSSAGTRPGLAPSIAAVAMALVAARRSRRRRRG